MNEIKPPNCQCCGKPLRKFTIPVIATDEPKDYKGRPILKITYVYKFIGGEKSSFYLWLGDFGGYGDNLFCGLKCGYKWAIRRLKKHPLP